MPEKRKAGQPTKYRKDFARQLAAVQRLFSEGATDDALAAFFAVSEATIKNWRVKYPEFLASIKGTKDEIDRDVERALYQRAIGYEHPEDKIFNNNGDVVRVNTMKHYPPDTAAAFIWLKNRQPEKWRDKQEIEHSGSINLTIDKDDSEL